MLQHDQPHKTVERRSTSVPFEARGSRLRSASGARTAFIRCAVPSTAVCLAAFVASAASAGDRRFTYTYEADTAAPGTVEYEQWITWKTDKDTDSEFDRVEFRHELEFGLTDNLQLGLYLSDWRSQRGSSVRDRVEWRNVAAELIYNLADPVTDPIGSALYGEVKVGDELFEVEGKLILQKNLGPWTLAWNGIAEAEWEGPNYDEDKGELAQTLGISYEITPSVLVGFEAVHEVEYDDWSEWGDHVVYVGPNASFRTPDWWFTVTPLVQATDVDSEPNFQMRFIFGFDF